MANIVYIATSVDGYIATKDGGIDWLHEIPNPTGSDYGFSDFMNRIDALVMGRKTFETVLGFEEWPYSKLVFVWSKTLTSLDPDLKGKAELISGTARSVTQELRAKGFKNLYIDGGKTIQSFLNEGQIDELIITRIPVLLGEGTPLFVPSERSCKLKAEKTDIYEGGLVKTHYKVVG